MTLKALDTAIGVVLLYLLLTLGASVLVEVISNLRNWRGRMLYDAIGNMLEGNGLIKGKDLYDSPFIVTLGRQGAAWSLLDLFEPFGWRPFVNEPFTAEKKCFWKKRRPKKGTQPSYIPSSAFASALLYAICTRQPEASTDNAQSGAQLPEWQTTAPISPDTTLNLLDKRIGTLPDKSALWAVIGTVLATQARSVQSVRLALEKWFNDTMDRVSGWYKRRAQVCLLLMGLLMSYGGNIDTIAISNWLWQSDVARQAIVSAASDIAKTNATHVVPPETPMSTLATQVIEAEHIAADKEYPMGWSLERRTHLNLGSYLVGCLISAIAISMGSSFWFDALQNIIKLRGAGPRPTNG
jgi:hypothetical protein